MPKTIVNIITEDNPLPAYLFIKENYEAGDRLMYISAKDTEDDLDALSELFNVPATLIEEIVLKDAMDEFAYERICRTVYDHLESGISYWVNLAGGTRYMALAVQQVFEKFNTRFFYVQVEENLIVETIFNSNIYNDDDYFYPVRHRLSIAEYLRVHEIQNDLATSDHQPIRSEAQAAHLFTLFSSQQLDRADYEVMELLRRHYRSRQKIRISKVESPDDLRNPAIPHLSKFLAYIGFIPQINDVLNHSELEYLTGGWFEEYVYYQVEKYVQPQDIALSAVISRKGVRHTNELDVVFTKGNKLFVIECKTGVQTERLFNEIVYKACAISESLLGVSCYSYIFSLKKDDDDLLKCIAANMDITFVDYGILTSPRKLRLIMAKIGLQAKDASTLSLR